MQISDLSSAEKQGHIELQTTRPVHAEPFAETLQRGSARIVLPLLSSTLRIIQEDEFLRVSSSTPSNPLSHPLGQSQAGRRRSSTRLVPSWRGAAAPSSPLSSLRLLSSDTRDVPAHPVRSCSLTARA